MIQVRKIGSIFELNLFLNGGLLSSRKIGNLALYGLHGKTLEFTSPAGTVTFATPGSSLQEGLTLKEIVTQINAIHSGYARMYKEALVLSGPSPVVLDASSTALELLGFDKAGMTGVAYGKPGDAAPALISVAADEHAADTWVLVTEEV